MNSKRPALAFGAALTFVVAGAALLWAATLFLEGFGFAAVDAREREVNQAGVDPVVESYRAEQSELLDRAEWIDRENGVVKLPIERAMELVVEEQGGASR